MNWRIEFSKRAERFVRKHDLLDKVTDSITRFLKAREGGSGAPDVKTLKGPWKGYYRIRLSDVRVIFELDKDNRVVHIETIDGRGGAYRR